MSASEPTRPDTHRLEPASTTPRGAETHRDELHSAQTGDAEPPRIQPRRVEPTRIDGTRLEQCLGGALCLLALASGVWVGLRLRAAAAEAEGLPERRAEVASLSPVAKDQLREQYARFARLESEQQQRLRDFDSDLAAADDAEQLRETLKRFSDWLRTVSFADRNELVKMAGDPERRVHRVEQLSPFSRADAAAFDKWLKSLPPWARWSQADLDKLGTQLSELRRSELEEKANVNEKRALVWSWLQRRRSPTEPRFGPASNEELVHFYNELDGSSRRKLLAMPREQRNEKLREQYRKAHSPEGGKRPVSAPRPNDE